MSEMVFQFKAGARLKGDPQRVGEELERVRCSNGGLTARAVVRTARSKRHYLHQYFTWDDRVAAEKYREEEARHLIRSVVVQFTDEDKRAVPVRAFVAVGHGDEPYVPMAVVLSQQDLRARLLAKATEELSWFRQKYCDLTELANVFAAIDELASTAASRE